MNFGELTKRTKKAEKKLWTYLSRNKLDQVIHGVALLEEDGKPIIEVRSPRKLPLPKRLDGIEIRLDIRGPAYFAQRG